MGSTTPNLGLPYPSLSDPPNGPSAFAALALATDAVTNVGGPGAITNVSLSGGANHTSGLPFLWVNSFVVNTSGSTFTITTSGQTFVGVGAVFISPGAGSNNLAFTQINQPTVSGGNVTVTGSAWSSGPGGTLAPATTGLIRLSVMIVGW